MTKKVLLFVPKHFHNLLLPLLLLLLVNDVDDVADDDDVVDEVSDLLLFVVAAVAVAVCVLFVVLFVLSSHFLFLIKSRFTLTLSRKCGHSIFDSICKVFFLI